MPVDSKLVVIGTSIVVGSVAAAYWLGKRRKGRPPTPPPQSAPIEPAPKVQPVEPELESRLQPSTSAPASPIKPGWHSPVKAKSSNTSPVKTTDSTKLGEKMSESEKVPDCTAALSLPEFGPNLSWSDEVEKETNAAMKRVSLKEDEERSTTPPHSNTDSQVSPASSGESLPPRPLIPAGKPTSDSPFAPSDHHSEASLDSGRGGSTAPGNSPPIDSNGIHHQTGPIEPPPIYEFEIPQHIVGLIIGKKGVVIKDLTAKSGTWILIRDHNWKDNYKICTIEGTREQINSCLRMIRRRFPPSRYPDLNLNPLLPPPIASPNSGMWGSMVQLPLPDGVPCEVVVSAIVDAGHVFVQQPTHPSFSSLAKLDQYMIAVYSQPNGIPALPTPVEMGVVCAAPALGGWYRALTVELSESGEVLVKFVDYGGYTRLPASDLKQIRSDFMSLPFQAAECYLANVLPNDNDRTNKKWKAVPAKEAGQESIGWSQEAASCVEELLCHKVVEAQVAFYAQDNIPCVRFFTTIEAPDGKTVSTEMASVLVEEGYAKWADPPSPEHRQLGGPFRPPPLKG